jgi:hypothetical protein
MRVHTVYNKGRFRSQQVINQPRTQGLSYDTPRGGEKTLGTRLVINMASTGDLKIDWIWHLLINVPRILEPEISPFVWQTIQVIGPTRSVASTRLFKFLPLSFRP